MTATADDICDLIAHALADAACQWSIGTFGAIAEFARDPDEDADVDAAESMAVTARGGIRLAVPAGMIAFASESVTRESWSHRVSLCLPVADAAMNGRAALTELGPDAQALRAADRDGVLFDLGLGVAHLDACIRVPAEAADSLRAYCGRALFESGNPAIGAIMARKPHRVFVSRLGRVEVFQPIPPPGGVSPEGPHTHILPKLLAHRRTHAATEPTPEGMVPCAHLYPAHPAKDAMGRAKRFAQDHHTAFQALLARFGDPDTVTLKRRVREALDADEPPMAAPQGRFASAALRVALRQAVAAGQGSAQACRAWMAAHDGRAHRTADEDEAEGQHA